MSADITSTEATPDLWNTDQVRQLVIDKLQEGTRGCSWCSACGQHDHADAVMAVLRDVMATVAAAQFDSASRMRGTIERLRDHLEVANAQLAFQDVDRDHHRDLMRLMEAQATVEAVHPDGHVHPAGKIAGIADHPTVIVDCADGKRRVLPQTFAYREVPAS